MEGKPHIAELRKEIMMARQRVHAIAPPTPLDVFELAGGPRVCLKREDLGPIHAYKWRGAYNRMAALSEEELARGVVTASAGNHAQGVALAARKLGSTAKIFMPNPTPLAKRRAVDFHGGERVEVVIVGDTYDEASAAAHEEAKQSGRVFVGAFNDILTMAGQGTLADEAMMSGKGPFDAAFLQIGGGGMAAACAAWLKWHMPDIWIVGVEGEGQASMKAAIDAGEPVALKELDVFCDGTAVRKAGSLTYPLCRDLVDEFVQISNAEACAAIRELWNQRRCVAEPAGAMGFAGLMRQAGRWAGKTVLAVQCGSNMDFGQFSVIARKAGLAGPGRRHLRFEIGERKGSLLSLLENHWRGHNIIDFQYGKTDPEKAWFIVGFEGTEEEMRRLDGSLADCPAPFEDVSAQTDIEFRVIPFRSDLMRWPLFARVEFHERAGALLAFLQRVSPLANVCYFNYAYSGERVGRALLGFEFASEADRNRFCETLPELAASTRACVPLDEAALRRMLA